MKSMHWSWGTARYSWRFVAQRLTLLGGGLALLAQACSTEPTTNERIGQATSQLVGVVVGNGPITISGQVTDAAGLGRSGVTVTLSGNVLRTLVTDSSGLYSFSGLQSGSYSVRPTRSNCSFLPDVINLNNLSSSSTVDFGGAGSGCGGEPTVGRGATSGPLTISGRVRDSSGNAVVGARINLGGSTQAIRFTDFAGGYAFHVSPGSYSLSSQVACSLSPSNANLNNITTNAIQNFTATTTSGCTLAQSSSIVATGRILKLTLNGAELGRTLVNVQSRSSAASALARLDQIAAEQPVPSTSLTFMGNPAIERDLVMPSGRIVLDESATGPKIRVLTTAVAVNGSVVRFETHVNAAAPAAVVNQFVSAARNLASESVPALTSTAPGTRQVVQNAPAVPSPLPVAVAPGSVGQVGGENAVAASDSANAMVVATSSGPFFSLDAGKTLQVSTWNRVAPAGAVAFTGRGDPFAAIGAPDANGKQTFYMTHLAQVTAGNPPTVAIGLFQSTDNGQTFNAASTAFPLNCSTAGCLVPDQVILAADRRNRALDASGNSFDQLYMGWRHFVSVPPPPGSPAGTPAGLARSLAVACSADGGATWNIDLTTLAATGGDYPRLAVGPDGSFSVVYGIFAGKNYGLTAHRFSSCASGFQPQPAPFPVTVANATNAADMAGMPRQPNANYGVTASQSDTTGKTLFVAYTDESSAGNDDIRVAQTSDGGSTWPTDRVVNTSSTGHRYFPSICSTGSTAFVSWYDRRAGGDLTAYVRSSLLNNGATIGAEFNVTGKGFEDPQCLTGFPGGGATTSAAELQCTNLPNVPLSTGQCQAVCPAGGNPPCGSLSKCDYRPGIQACPAGETCSVPAGAVSPGAPKYGDYNYTDCARGRVFMSWATGKPPFGGCALDGLTCTAGAGCCSGNCVGGVCAPTAAACTATGGGCTVNNDCCSRSCQGGQCFAPVGVYAASTSCTGDVPSDLTCGAGELKATISGSDSSQTFNGPFKVCGTGSGFSPNGQVGITWFHPALPTAGTSIVTSADASGKVKYSATQAHQTCSLAEYQTPVKVVISDEATGELVTFDGNVPDCFVCFHVILDDGTVSTPVCPTDFNGGCP